MLSEFSDCNKKVKQPERRQVDMPEGFESLKREFNPNHHRLLNENPKAKAKTKATTAKQTLKPKTNKIIKMLMKGKKNSCMCRFQ